MVNLRSNLTISVFLYALFMGSSAVGQTFDNGLIARGYTTMGGVGGTFRGQGNGAFAGAAGQQPTAQTPTAFAAPNVPAFTDRVSVMNLAASGLASVSLPVAQVAALCADLDGCQVRLGRQDANSNGVIEFTSTIWFLNPSTGDWRTENRVGGKDANGTNDNVLNIGTCFLGDGERADDGTFSDSLAMFGVFSTAVSTPAANGNPAIPATEDCVVTLIN